MKYFLAVFALGLTLDACSSDSKTDPTTTTTTTKADSVTAVASPPPAPTPAPAAATPDSAVAGFDPASAPEGQNPSGGFPYFSLIEGSHPADPKSMSPSGHRQFIKNVAYDRYEFWDGTKIIPVDGRLYAMKAEGAKDASWFQVKKTYEKLIKDLGGVTVFEGKSGQQIEDLKKAYKDSRQRGSYPSYLNQDETGVYMVRTPDKQLWVEVDKPGNYEPGEYWLTVVETKPLDMKVKMLPAEEIKKALDRDGHVALYINFDTDKTAMKAESAPIIAEIVKLFGANPDLKLTVEGHTDDAGTPAHNQTLSEGRANAVVGALMAQGIALERLQPKGFGQSKPLVPNDSEENKAKNRRVELVKR